MQNYIVNNNNNIIDLLPTYEQIRFATFLCFIFFLLGLTVTQLNTSKDKVVQFLLIICATFILLSNLVLFYLGQGFKNPDENFTDMPNPGINKIDNSFGKSFLSYHIKTAYDPHIQKSSTISWGLSAGSNKYKLNTKNLDYVLSRGVRGLCFSVVFANDEPRIVSGYFNNENKFVTHSSNYISLYDAMYYLNAKAHTKSKNIPNHKDPLCIILRLYSPQSENRTNKIASIINSTFKDKLKDDNGDYLKLSENTPLNELKKKVLLFISNEGDENLDSTRQNKFELDSIKFSNIGIYNKQNIQNSLTFSNQRQPSLTIPAEDGLQNTDACTLVTNNYFDHGINFIAINYNLENDSTKTCAYKYDQKFSNYGSAFILRN